MSEGFFSLIIDLERQQRLYSSTKDLTFSSSIESGDKISPNNPFLEEQFDYLICGQQICPAIILDSSIENLSNKYQVVIDSLTFSHGLLTSSSNTSVLSSESVSDLNSLTSPSQKSSPARFGKKSRGAKVHKMRSIESLLDNADKKKPPPGMKEQIIGNTVFSPLMTTVNDKPTLLLSPIYLSNAMDELESSSAFVTLKVSLYEHVLVNLMSSFLEEPRLGASYIRSLIGHEMTTRQQEQSGRTMARLELIAKLEASAPVKRLVKQVDMSLERESIKTFLVTFDLTFAQDHFGAKIDNNLCASLFSIDKADIEIRATAPLASSMHLNQAIFFKKLDMSDHNLGTLQWRCTVLKDTIEDLFSSISDDLTMRLALKCCSNSSTLNLFYESSFDVKAIFYSTKIEEHIPKTLHSSFPIQVEVQHVPAQAVLNKPFDLDLLLINKSMVTDYVLHVQFLPYQVSKTENDNCLVDEWVEHLYTSPPPFLPLRSSYSVARLAYGVCTMLTLRLIPMTEGIWYLPPLLIQATSSMSNTNSYTTNTMLPTQELTLNKLLKLKTILY